MVNKKILTLVVLFALFNSCSFDSKTGIWNDEGKEKKKITELENEQKGPINIEKVYSSSNAYDKEILLNKSIILPKPYNNSSWPMPNLNFQNLLGNLSLNGIDNVFLKKKIGRNKFSISQRITPILVIQNNLIFSDDTGTIFKINEKGKTIWKKNIYKKAYKNIYKKLAFSIFGSSIYVADNIGFVYSIDLKSGELVWIKNYEIPVRSNIKVFNNKIFLINQNNKIFCLNTKDGSLIWNYLSISSFIKTQNLLSLAITQDDNLVAITSSADIYKINSETGDLMWSRNTADSFYADATDFFVSSEIVIIGDQIVFSSGSNIFSLNAYDGVTLWIKEVSTTFTPIISGKNIFIVTNNGYFVILDKVSGKIVSSNNIFKILKKKERNTKITGFIMGSGKIYSMTSSGILIVSSATSGKTESFKKIGSVNSAPIVIVNGKLHLLTNKSKILILN